MRPETGAHGPALSAGFRLRRRIARFSFIAGLLLLMAGGASALPGDAPPRSIGLAAFWSGLALLASLFPISLLMSSRCPRCRRPFSESPACSGPDADGLPLFGRIEECPFCGLSIDRPRQVRGQGR